MTVRTPHVVKDDSHWLDPPEWWKKFKPLRWLAIATIVAGLGSGIWGAKEIAFKPGEHPETARYLAQATPRLGLGGRVFTSYSSLSSITAQLDQAGVAWLAKRNHRPTSTQYPPRNLDTLKVDKYSHLGVPGKLTLEFFNDRLFEVYFEPEDSAAYSAALYKAEPGLKRNRLGKVEISDGTVRLATNVDLASSDVGQSLHTTPFAIWQDLRLVRQAREWDAAYGAIPAPKDD